MIKIASAVSLLLLPLILFSAIGAAAEDFLAHPNISSSDLAASVLNHPRIYLYAGPRKDVESGAVDERLLATLLNIAQRHEITVSVLVTGHSLYVKGTHRISDHVFGRGVDISKVDGEQVTLESPSAFQVVEEVVALPSPLRPDETGSPWLLPAPGSFSDSMHKRHIHLGWNVSGESH
jgi:hypothetical protein